MAGIQQQPGDTDALAFSVLCQVLLDEGWERGAPTPEAEVRDRRRVEAHTCPHCGGPLAFQPFVRPVGIVGILGRIFHAYRPFAVCPLCDRASAV